MDARVRSTGPSAPMTNVKAAVAPAEPQPARRPRRGWPWLIVGVALVAVKSQALAGLLHHRVEGLVVLGLGLAFSVLRPRPVAIALFAAGLIAVALHLGSTGVGIAVALGAFTVLLALFMAIAAVLHARQRHGSEAVSRSND